MTLRARIETVLGTYPPKYLHCCYTAEEHKAHVVNELMAVLKPDIDAIAEAIYKGLHESGFDYTAAARAAVEAWMGQHD